MLKNPEPLAFNINQFFQTRQILPDIVQVLWPFFLTAARFSADKELIPQLLTLRESITSDAHLLY